MGVMNLPKRKRPNAECLYCGDVLLRKPTVHRNFLTCGDVCFRRMNCTLNFFNPEIRRRNGQSLFGLAMLWWTLGDANKPLTHSQIQSMARTNFGEGNYFNSKLFSQQVKYFKKELFQIDKSEDVFTFTCKQVPLNQALRPKFMAVLDNII